MRPVLWLLFLFALAVAVTLAARFDPGYVLIVVPPWRLEMSFVMAAFALALLYLAFRLLAGILDLALRLPADVRAWRQKESRGRAEDELARAVAAYLAGQHEAAGRLAADAFSRERRDLAALVAAHAALARGDRAAARGYIQGLGEGAEELLSARRAVEAALAAAETATPANLG